MDDDVRWLEPSQQRSWRAFLLGTTLLNEQLDSDLRSSFNLSLAEYEILVRLSEAPTHTLRMSHLAAAMCHSRSRITHTVSRMEGQGVVIREPSAEDGRGIHARLTPRGLSVLRQAARVHVSGVRRNIVDLVSEEDFEALGRVMDAVSDSLIGAHPEVEIRSVQAG